MAVWVKERIKGSGEWWMYIKHYTIEQGVFRKAKRIGQKKSADEIAREVRKQLLRGDLALFKEPEPSAPASPTFADYAASYLARIEPDPTRADGGIKAATFKDYRSVLKGRLAELLGTKPLAEITPKDIKALRARLETDGRTLRGTRKGQRLSRRNVDKQLRILSTVLTAAVDDELIAANPVLGAGAGKRRTSRERHAEERRRVDPLNETDLQQLLETAATHGVVRGVERVSPYARYLPLLLTLADTGMRVGEALALQWGDIHWRAGYVHVRRHYTCNVVDVPKTGRERHVFMTPRLKDTLWDEYQHRRRLRLSNVAMLDPAEQAAREAETDAELLESWSLPHPDNPRRLIELNNFRRRVWLPLLAAAGLKHYRIHDLRHTYASRMLARGANPTFIQRQLGHASLKMTLDTYSHYLPGSHEGLVTLLDGPENGREGSTTVNYRSTSAGNPVLEQPKKRSA